MLENNSLIKVTNRDNGSVGYTIPDLNNLTRTFQKGETKEITMEELRKLSYIPGGEKILRNYLIIQNEEAINELLNHVEPEYFYTEEDVKNLLINGSLDALKDCLEFAPAGTIDLVKKISVELPLNDVEKRETIYKMTGFNVDSAVRIDRESKEDDEEEQVTKTRRVTTTIENKAINGRRVDVNADKYKVINK